MNYPFGEAFWNIVRLYNFTDNEARILLNLEASDEDLATMKLDLRIPVDEDRIIRILHLIGIHKSLRTLFPYNRDVVYAWMRTARDLFGGLSAIQFICQDPQLSLLRLASVHTTLEITIHS